MRDYRAQEIRNICLLGHSGSGKSSLVEGLLLYTKATDRFCTTDSGNST